MSASTPAATGTLAATPLAGLLMYALERRLSGTFVFEAKDGTKNALTVQEGRVTNSRVDGGKLLLGDVCVSLGLLAPEEIESALDQAPGELLGNALLERGLAPEDLQRALAEQLTLHVEATAALPPETVWGYYASKDFLERWGAPRFGVEPLKLVWQAVRHVPAARVRDAVTRLEEVPTLRLHLRSRVGRFGFSPRESALLDVLRAKPQSYGELSRLGLLGRAELDRVLYALAMTRHLDMGKDALPLGVEQTPTRAPPAPAPSPAQPVEQPVKAVAAEDGERRRVIDELHERLDRVDYYELLGVSRDIDATGVQAAFFQLARQWHPDKLPRSLADQGERVNRIFARLTEAHRVLTNPTRRAEYDRLNQEGGQDEEDQAKVQQVLRAVTAFQKAEVMARRADWPLVVKFCTQAQADDPEQPEYAALLAFAKMKVGFANDSEADAAVQALNGAVDADRKNLRVKLYRAGVLKQTGRVTEAMKDYRAVVDADPTNVEAQREIRLFKMRRTEAVDEKPQGGRLFGKLFGKG